MLERFGIRSNALHLFSSALLTGITHCVKMYNYLSTEQSIKYVFSKKLFWILYYVFITYNNASKYLMVAGDIILPIEDTF